MFNLNNENRREVISISLLILVLVVMFSVLKVFDHSSSQLASTISSVSTSSNSYDCTGDLHTIVVNGVNSDEDDNDEFSDVVEENYLEPCDIEVDDVLRTNDAGDTEDALEEKVADIFEEDEHAKVLVIAHSLGAVATFNADLSEYGSCVQTILYDPPYGYGPGWDWFNNLLSFMPISELPNLDDMREAYNDGIADEVYPNNNWTDGTPNGDDDHTQYVDNPDVLSDINEVLEGTLGEDYCN